MNSRRYWKNRLPFLLTNLVCMAALTVFLLVCGNSVSAVVLILIVWALILLTGLVLTYWKRKRQMKKLLDMAEQLSERYLISEVMELPEQAEDQVYYQLLKMAGKSMLEQIGEVERERLEYKEYIEQLTHFHSFLESATYLDVVPCRWGYVRLFNEGDPINFNAILCRTPQELYTALANDLETEIQVSLGID